MRASHHLAQWTQATHCTGRASHWLTPPCHVQQYWRLGCSGTKPSHAHATQCPPVFLSRLRRACVGTWMWIWCVQVIFRVAQHACSQDDPPFFQQQDARNREGNRLLVVATQGGLSVSATSITYPAALSGTGTGPTAFPHPASDNMDRPSVMTACLLACLFAKRELLG